MRGMIARLNANAEVDYPSKNSRLIATHSHFKRTLFYIAPIAATLLSTCVWADTALSHQKTYKNTDMGFEMPCPADCDVRVWVNTPDRKALLFYLLPYRQDHKAIRVSKLIDHYVPLEGILKMNPGSKLGEAVVDGRQATILRLEVGRLEVGASTRDEKQEYEITYWIKDLSTTWELARPEGEKYKPPMDQVITGFKFLPASKQQ